MKLISSIYRKCRKLTALLRSKTLKLKSINLVVGSNISIGKFCEIFTSYGGKIELADGCSISKNSSLIASRGKITIEENVFIGIGSVVTSMESIHIGAGTQIAEYVTVRDQDHNIVENTTLLQSGFTTAPIRIEENVWIGAKATITKGVTIGKNSIIGANAVVTKSIPENSVAAGIPARLIKQRTHGP